MSAKKVLRPLPVVFRNHRLTVISDAGFVQKNSGHKRMVRVLCDCGNEKVMEWNDVRSGNSKSCGCAGKEQAQKLGLSRLKHGHNRIVNGAKSKEYQTWASMIQRCENKNVKAYKFYGGRGIKVCDRWRESFEAFYEDMGQRPDRKSLDRYPDKNGNYEPGNCRWATDQEQGRNARGCKLTEAQVIEIKNDHRNQGEIAKDYGVSRSAINHIKCGRTWAGGAS